MVSGREWRDVPNEGPRAPRARAPRQAAALLDQPEVRLVRASNPKAAGYCERELVPQRVSDVMSESEAHATEQAQYIIEELSIDGVMLTMCNPHPERTPIGPFDSREAAWEYAHWMQVEYGSGGGSVGVSPLHHPRPRPDVDSCAGDGERA